MIDIFGNIIGHINQGMVSHNYSAEDTSIDNYDSYDVKEQGSYDSVVSGVESSIYESDINPYASGFDEEHPLPTYDELRNAGFTDFEAKQITYHTYTSYSEKELFDVLYSENPKEAYDAMMYEKVNKLDDKINRLITSLGNI